MKPEVDALLEKLAELEHNQWMSWTKYLVDHKIVTDAPTVMRWMQLWVPYGELSEENKEKDRKWAKKITTLLVDEPTLVQHLEEFVQKIDISGICLTCGGSGSLLINRLDSKTMVCSTCNGTGRREVPK